MPSAVASMVAPLTNRFPPTPEIGSGCPACQSIDVVLPPTWTDVIVAPPTPRSAVVTVIGIGSGGLSMVAPSMWMEVTPPTSMTWSFAGSNEFVGADADGPPASTPPLSSRVCVALSQAR